MTIRLVLADDHPIVLDGLAQLFSRERDCEVLARATRGEEALRAVFRYRPDILVLDIRMPGKDGLAVLREMKRDASSTRTVVLTALGGDEIVEAIRLGARGIVLKDMAPQLLMLCVRAVHAGNKWLDKGTQASDKSLKREPGKRDIDETLTPRELAVARMIAKGMRNKAVAAKMAITEGTVKLHLHHAYEKLEIDGRIGLIQYLQSRGLD